MSDPLDRLRDFGNEGASMNPLPAAEIRRRGDRMRRRRNVTVGVAGAVAALAIGTPLAVAGLSGSDDPDSTPDVVDTPSAPDGGWLQEVPSGFDPGEGMLEDANLRRDEIALDSLELCGETVWDAGADTVDVAGATYVLPNTSFSQSHTVALYPDDTGARAAAERIATAVDECSEEPGSEGVDLVHERFDPAGAGAASFVLVSRARNVEEDVFMEGVLRQVVRSGNALLVTETYTGATTDADLEVEIELQEESTKGLLDSMCVFGLDPCTLTERTAFTIGPDGAGPWTLGMPLDQALAAGAEDQQIEPGNVCSMLRGEHLGQDVLMFAHRDRGVISIVNSELARTPEGISVGSTVDDVSAAYPDGDGDGRSYLAPIGGGHVYAFTFGDDGTVASIALGGPDAELCDEEMDSEQ